MIKTSIFQFSIFELLCNVGWSYSSIVFLSHTAIHFVISIGVCFNREF